MCLTVYVASSEPMPRILQDEHAQSFFVDDVDEERRSVVAQFSLPHVAYVGATGGCGCAFCFGEWGSRNFDDGWAHEPVEHRAELASWMREALDRGVRLELFACWDGDQGEPAVGAGVTTPTRIVQEPLVVEERVLLRVLPDSI